MDTTEVFNAIALQFVGEEPYFTVDIEGGSMMDFSRSRPNETKSINIIVAE